MIKLRKDKPICPKCNGIIIEKENSWVCSNKINKNHCNFEMPNHRDGKKLDISMLINYQNCEGNDKISKLAVDTFNENHKRRMKIFNFNDEQLELFENGIVLQYDCPHCSDTLFPTQLSTNGRLYYYKNTIRCINTLSNECYFKIEDNYNGVKFSIEEIRNMISNKTSFTHTFINPLTKEKEIGKVFFDIDYNENIKYPFTKIMPKYLFFKDIDDFMKKYSPNKSKSDIYPATIKLNISGEFHTVGRIYENKLV